jgi:hypothetical protein
MRRSFYLSRKSASFRLITHARARERGQLRDSGAPPREPSRVVRARPTEAVCPGVANP